MTAKTYVGRELRHLVSKILLFLVRKKILRATLINMQ